MLIFYSIRFKSIIVKSLNKEGHPGKFRILTSIIRECHLEKERLFAYS